MRRQTTTRRIKRKDKRRGIAQLLFVIVIVFAIPLGMKLWIKMKIDALSYRLAILQKEREQLTAEVMKLRVEREALVNPERIKKKASAMGLREAREGQIVILK